MRGVIGFARLQRPIHPRADRADLHGVEKPVHRALEALPIMRHRFMDRGQWQPHFLGQYPMGGKGQGTCAQMPQGLWFWILTGW